MRLRRIAFKGFLRFKEHFEVEFPQGQVTLIAGENGAGKTSILDALCICLYGRTFRTSGRTSSGFLGIGDLVNNGSKNAAIRVEFENQGHNYVVTRGITRTDSSGEILEDGVSKAIGRHVYAYVRSRAIGLDWEGFTKSTVVLQGEMSALTDMDPGPRKKAFTQLFGLDKYSVYEKGAKEKADRKASDIHATNEANKILEEDIKDVPKAKETVRRLGRQVLKLRRRKEKLRARVESRKKNLDELEDGHNGFVAQQERVNGNDSQIEVAGRAAKRSRDELARLESIQKSFPTISKSYDEYSLLDEKLLTLQPSKREFDSLSKDIHDVDVELREQNKTFSDILGQTKEVKQDITRIRKEIPSQRRLAGVRTSLEQAKEKERDARGRGSNLRGQIKQIDVSIGELKAKKGQVKGKDRCPVCLQKISNPGHVMKHYDDEVNEAKSQRSKLERESTSTSKRQNKLAERVKRLESLERELTRRASKVDQLARERRRLDGLGKKSKILEGQLAGIRKEAASLEERRAELGFDSAEYDGFDKRIKEFRKRKVVELYTNAKTELDRLPLIRAEAESSQSGLAALLETRRELKSGLKALAKVEGNYAEAKRLYEGARSQLEESNASLAREAENERNAKERLSELDNKAKKLKDNLIQIRKFNEEITLLQELRDIFKNIPENILRRLRPFIEKEGTDVINDLSDSEMTALNIEEETLNVAATTNGEIRPIHYFSGGQKTRINMALRVAISRILSRMPQTREHTFAIMQTLFIDEGDFGNLDEPGIRDAVNVIRNLTKEFNRVILISHVDTIREIFHGYTVEVMKTGMEESKILSPTTSDSG